MLYKKGDPLLLSNYRPIALANAVYKVWTGLLTMAMSRYAEHIRILSQGQEGFRKYRNTMRSLQSLLNVYEDARLSRQNVYAVYIDYSNAFNTINQDKLLQVLYDLGFPNVAIDAVKDTYHGAVTGIETSAGMTSDITVDQGVLQGDTLSPFLFNCFTEPPTRWLHVWGSGRGNSLACMSKANDKTQMKSRTASCGYADDTTLLISTVSNMALQMGKVEQYSEWGNSKLNISKCAATGMPRQDKERHAIPLPMTKLGCDRLRQQLTAVNINGQPVPFAHPDSDPQRLLGVSITPSLNWKPQVDRILEEARLRARNITEPDASPQQKLAWIQTCLKPYLTYSFPLTYLNKQDIYSLDAGVAQAAKKANTPCHFHRSCASTAEIFRSRC